MKISKILIANRGEIAIRIMHTAKKLGIKTVAVYSTPDINSKFVTEADDAIHLEGFSSAETYLNIEKILEAIDISGADAVHPGYGFLSENSAFVEILEEKKINFIGPSSFSMKQMGNKISSKIVAKSANVPVVPGIVEEISVSDNLSNIIKKIGFPMIIKASSGGGGKGMKIVYKKEELESAITSARNEAKHSFGNDAVFIEKYIEKPRHIEIQIIADQYGNIVCLGERECSIQRFNQKIIEEAPSSFVTQSMRDNMYKTSYKLIRKCKYFSAGTIEYIVDQNGNFYFLEMNTRLQVEHPVTEYVTGIDIVEQMINVANGKKLSFKQSDIKIKGWAFESRICAEDPYKNFMPSIGRITEYKEPLKNYNVRVDSGVRKGSEISPYYDAMIAKIITYGDSRKEAIVQMRNALSQFQIDGIATNTSMIETIMRNERFVHGNISTWFIKEEYPDGFKGVEIGNDIIKLFILASVSIYMTYEKKFFSTTQKTEAIQDKTMEYDKDKAVVIIDKKEYMIDEITEEILHNENCLTSLKCADEKISILHNYKSGDRVIRCFVDNEELSLKVSYISNGKYILSSGGITKEVCVYQMHIAQYLKYMPLDAQEDVSDTLVSPITGKIVKINIKSGDNVVIGQDLMRIEAMKMENIILSERSGIIKKICFKESDTVNHSDILVVYK